MLMDELEEISDGLIDKLFQEDDKIDYPSFYLKLEAQYRRVSEIFSRTLRQRIDYHDALSKKMQIAVDEEDYLKAAEIKKRRDYFHRGFLDEIPKKYLPK
jgi:hypothetical protein